MSTLFCDDPADFFGNSYTRMHSIPRDELLAMQLSGLQARFSSLRESVPVLGKMADAVEIDRIEKIEDVVPLLFDHSVYKSYPDSLLEEADFSGMNRWLSTLTSFDLESVDVSDCSGIDDWIDTMLASSPIAIGATPGADGSMSFLPIAKSEMERHTRTFDMVQLQDFGEAACQTEKNELHVINPGFRHPGDGYRHGLDLMVEHLLDGNEDRLHVAYSGRMSMDVMSLSIRLDAAQASGTSNEIDVPQQLLERKQEFDRLRKEMPRQMESLVDRCVETLRGKRVLILGPWGLLHNLASRGLARGLENVFSADSAVIEGGSTEGAPDNWRADVCRFFGVPRIKGMYAMHEMLARNMKCEHGHYHLAPWIIPFVLDPDTSQPLPREGTVTGRLAFVDLLADTHWGGFITGDEVSTDWSTPCPCGQTSFFLEGSIRRYSQSDKIQGALRDDAFNKAMDQLQQTSS